MNESVGAVKQNGHILGLLAKQAKKLGHSREQLARALGISYQRLHQYERGLSRVADAKKETLAAIGRYLEIPVIWVMLMTGHISDAETLWPGDEQKTRLRLALGHMRADPWLAAMMPDEIDQSSARIQEFVVMLYRMLRAGGLVNDSAYRSIVGLNNFEKI